MSLKQIFGSAALLALVAGAAAAQTDATTATTTETDTDAATSDTATTTTETATEEVAPDVGAAATTDTSAADANAMVDVDISGIDAEALLGAHVYDKNDKRIGEVSDILLGSDGASSQAVVDVGGFLGIGEKPVALSFDQLSIKSDGDASYTVYVGMTEAELEAMPTYGD